MEFIKVSQDYIYWDKDTTKMLNENFVDDIDTEGKDKLKKNRKQQSLI